MITRYELVNPFKDKGYMDPYTWGDYILYTDHEELVENLEDQIKILKKKIEKAQDALL